MIMHRVARESSSQNKYKVKVNAAISLYKGELQIALVNKSHLFLSLSLDVIIIIIFVKL